MWSIEFKVKVVTIQCNNFKNFLNCVQQLNKAVHIQHGRWEASKKSQMTVVNLCISEKFIYLFIQYYLHNLNS